MCRELASHCTDCNLATGNTRGGQETKINYCGGEEKTEEENKKK
jgi:hypothetical protein